MTPTVTIPRGLSPLAQRFPRQYGSFQPTQYDVSLLLPGMIAHTRQTSCNYRSAPRRVWSPYECRSGWRHQLVSYYWHAHRLEKPHTPSAPCQSPDLCRRGSEHWAWPGFSACAQFMNATGTALSSPFKEDHYRSDVFG